MKKTQTTDKVKKLGQVFTPPKLVNEMLDKLPKNVWTDPSKTWLDPACGDGAFLVEVLRRLIEAGGDKKHIIENQIFGIDIDPDAIKECIDNLGVKDMNHNIIVGDALELGDDMGQAFMLHRMCACK